MRLSTKGRYGTRAMLELAMRYPKGPTLVKEVARTQEISAKYLDRIFASLKTGGLVKSVRGAKGGYVLASPPSQIKIGQIIQALEGSISPVECVDDPKFCSRANLCVTRDLWRKMKELMDSILNSTTLEGLVEEQKKKNKLHKSMYYI